LGLNAPAQLIRTITPPPRPDPTQGVRPDASRIARQEKRNARAELIKKLKKVSKASDPNQRNSVVREIVEDYLKKSIKVFEARWTEGTALTDEVFLATPLFWYKRHKWLAKDIKELFEISGINRPTLDSELTLLYDLDGTGKNRKKTKKPTHLRKESMNHLEAARKDQQKRFNSRSMIFVGHDKINAAANHLWKKFIGPKYADAKEINHDQFDILLNEWKIEVDPNVSAEIYYELLINAEEYDKEQVSGDQQNNTINGNDDSQKLKLKPRFEENGTQSNRFHSDILAIRQQFDLSQSLPSIDETANNNKRLPTNISRSVDELNEINQKEERY